ncbi:uncharacterized protein LOC126965939 isoform X2 [Leptidea sinapis]|uniref:uncharacterized protein LOC126965939 isoform X2 n=1 Tax=Leptidea sinapis TaxID=189913 RepID=UPI0021C42D4D|nr:uncharacterized protein LOC126965939 isoform X2 [Leptidea sinapis]
MVSRIGINGFGRIGRVVAINDPAIDIEYICYLIKFDSTHGKFKGNVSFNDNEIHIDDKVIKVFREKLPANIPWNTVGVRYVVEASGMFTCLEKASGHLSSGGVYRVFVTAPSVDIPMFIVGVNDHMIGEDIKVISCASSTLYCLAPIMKILEENYGISEGFITSIHSMTPSLKPLDGLCLKGKHWRDHRSIHQNIIPAVTGACKALGRIVPSVKDKLSGVAFRVPIVNVSVLDISIRLMQNTTLKEIVNTIENHSVLRKLIKTCDEEAVSSDFLGEEHSCIIDINSSIQLKPNFYKLICWYENEFSYACRVIDAIMFSDKQLRYNLKSLIARFQPINAPSEAFPTGKCSCGLNPKMFSNTVQNIGLKNIYQTQKADKKCTTLSTEQLPLRNLKKTNEVLKKWNENNKNGTCHNENPLLHNLISCELNHLQSTHYMKSQERLQKVKEKFNRMLNMTEDLLKQSTSRKSVNVGETTTHKKAIIDNDCNSINLKNEGIQKTNPMSGDCNTDDMHELNISNSIKDKNDIESDIFGAATGDSIVIEKDNDADIRSQSMHESLVIKSSECKNSTNQFDKLAISGEILGDLSISNVAQDISVTDTIRYGLDESNTTSKCTESPSSAGNKESLLKIDMVNVLTQSEPNVNSIARYQYSVTECSLNNENLPSSYSSKYYLENTESTNNDIGLITNTSYDLKAFTQARNSGVEKRLDKAVVESTTSVESSTFKSLEKEMKNSITSKRHSQDIYDKLDSASVSGSETSFDMNGRKSQVININDLTNSLEDLSRLDKICKIMEISDELSDKLFSALKNSTSTDGGKKKWSFKDLCERINLDEFCNNVFGK